MKKCIEDQSFEIRLAAAEALANQPDAANDALIEKAAGPGYGRMGKRAAKARLRLASNLRRAGDKDAAAKIYQAISTGKFDPAQKKAATAALRRSAKPGSRGGYLTDGPAGTARG